jgi:UDP:flavonoid glycosyltransferase YjiC (YdhE family)
MGGISESIFFSVPMLLLPKTIEQQINANRMNELGASINLKGIVYSAYHLCFGSQC